MRFVRVKGNTCYFESWENIPVYLVNEKECILMDTGTVYQREELENALKQEGLKPVGVLCSHVHTDHAANNRYFQEKYRIPVCLPEGEAELASSYSNLKSCFYMLTYDQIRKHPEGRNLMVRADQVIGHEDADVRFCGVDFGIIHTPGHSLDHISVRTPDNVLYLGDALLTGTNITKAKLPFFFILKTAMESMESLRNVRADLYLAAHKGVYEKIEDIIDLNIRCLKEKTGNLKQLLREPLTQDAFFTKTFEFLNIHNDSFEDVVFLDRNIRVFLEYLVDTGEVKVIPANGTLYYQAVSG